jgi:hypothetical protein
LTLDIESENNIGTVEELGERIFEGTGWEVDSEKIPQKTEDTLFEISLSSDLNLSNVVRLDDASSVSPIETYVGSMSIAAGQKFYLFYSTLKDKAERC